MEDGDVVEIPPPVNWCSKPKSLKRKEVFCPDIINIDDYEDCYVSILDSGKSDTRFKGKQAFTDLSLHSSAGTHNNASENDVKFMGESYGGSHYSNETFYKDLIYVDDDQMEYAFLQSHFDDFDIPPGIEVSIPCVSDVNGNNMNSFTGSASTQSASRDQADPKGFPSLKASYPMPLRSETEHVKANCTSGFDTKKLKPCSTKPAASGNVQVSSSCFSGKSYEKMGPSQAYGFHETSDRGKKPLPPHVHVLHSIQNQTSNAANSFPKALMPTRNDKPQTSHEQVLHGLKNHISTAANNFPKASMPTCNDKPLTTHEQHLRIVQNQFSTAANNFPKASMPTRNEKRLELHEQGLNSLQKRMSTAASKIPNASIPTGNGGFNNLGPNMSRGMSSNVGVNHMFPGYNVTPQNPSSAISYYSGGFTFSDSTAFNPLFRNSMGIQKDFTSTGNVSSSSGPTSSKIVNENPDVILKKLDLFKKFDTVEDFSDHFFSKSNAFAMNQPARSWAKKIQDEWKILEKDLPDTIFVRVYESRMDLLRAAIIGAEGTPYHDGLFFFDMFFPSNYPNVPPQVKYHSGGLRINPNLYNCIKVCLSLLNTWGGSVKEMWIPGESTVLQVLVSIQGLILNAKPYFNEPGYAYSGGTVTGETHSLHYNENTFIYSLKTMVYSIRKPPKHFEDLVVGHFFKRAHDILVACRAYKNGAQVGSVVVKGGVANVNNRGHTGNSQKFMKELSGYLKTLVEAFGQVGVKD